MEQGCQQHSVAGVRTAIGEFGGSQGIAMIVDCGCTQGEDGLESYLNLSIEQHVACITLNRPASMNALSGEMLEALSQMLDSLQERVDIRALMITGAGRAFCAGGDLHAFRQHVQERDFDGFHEKLLYAQRVFNKLERFPVPTVAAVNGYAIAGGLELLLCCDLVVAADTAQMGDGHARYGVIPAGGSSARLPRKISPNRANYLLLTGELISASMMQEWGLVNSVVSPSDLYDAAQSLAQKMALLSPAGLRHIKKLAVNSLELSTEQACAAELDAFKDYAQSRDFAEGLQAFYEKRSAVY